MSKPGLNSIAELQEAGRKIFVWNRLEDWSPRIWPLTLGLGLLVLLVAGYNLYLTIKSDRPEFVVTDAVVYKVNSPYAEQSSVNFTWINMGKRPARQGEATLFSVSDDGKRYEKFEKGEIIDNKGFSLSPYRITVITPSAEASFRVKNPDMSRFLELFLECVDYYDGENNRRYRQSFLFKLGPKKDTTDDNGRPWGSNTRLDPSSKHQVCPTQR